MIQTHSFASRHIGPRPEDVDSMLESLGLSSLDALIDATVPAPIRSSRPLSQDVIGNGLSEHDILAELRGMAERNQVFKSYIGMGYHGCYTPPVILRNVLEDPRWYTPYTPYQAEVAQGRLEALLNFQTMVIDLTGMEIANASLLDEGTAAAEAMGMCAAIKGVGEGAAFFVAEDCHPTTIAIVQSRARPLGIEVIVGGHRDVKLHGGVIGALIQYPATDGAVYDYSDFVRRAHEAGALVAVAADILSLALLKPPGEWGADIVVGNTQRFGVPMGYGGPHAAYLAAKEEHKRLIPGRIVGLSRDAEGRPAIRLALQTREQHIRREKATSNICTAQVLLAVTASMYAVYHGPEGIREIARHTHRMARLLDAGLRSAGVETGRNSYFDTVRIAVGEGAAAGILERAAASRLNLRRLDRSTFAVSVDETTTEADILELVRVFTGEHASMPRIDDAAAYPSDLARISPYLSHPVFNRVRSETDMLRYLNKLQSRDLSLAESMTPLGSCTMKLNATAEMIPITWPGFNQIHPFAPRGQASGYGELITRLEAMLAEITSFDAISLQPNAGSQGEYAGLLVIKAYHEYRGDFRRDVCLIPQSAHGTNPATAHMAGMRIVVVRTDESGNVDVQDLRAKAAQHADSLAALMITYPSTHGVFEEGIREICDVVHRSGGQVYMDGANMNAQVGLCRPGEFGPDVCHLNLHKTFCIPHGGGGPGMGPIGVKHHLAPFLPRHPVIETGGKEGIGAISSAPWGSPSILPISYAYIRMMGVEGLKRATEIAILNANYVAKRLDPHFPVLYKGSNGLVAHECIVDVRPVKPASGIEVEDVAKRLMDYGFHAPTVSFPVAGTLMIEPTESESKEELDRFCEAMISIREEIAEIENGSADRQNNLLKNAPHTASAVTDSEWDRPYTRERAAFPASWVREWKYWPPVARIDAVYGERNLVCACPAIEAYE